MTLTDAEAQVASKLLKKASALFSQVECNDLVLENTEANYALVRAMYVADGQEGECPPYDPYAEDLHTHDWWMMLYLSERLDRR